MAKPKQYQSNRDPSTERLPPASADAPAIAWSVWPRVVVTLLILWHLAAVALPPLFVGPSGESPLWKAVAAPFWPYIEAADLNHGYRFFGPDPGPSHLVRYHLEMPDGTSRDGFFPNLAEERPRLLYHRYFMLSEHLNGLYEGQMIAKSESAPGLPEDSPQRRATEVAYHALVRSYADELLRRTGAKSVHMELIEHDFPSPEESLSGLRLDDKSLYRKLDDLGTFTEQTP
jgi:hypothetical protein